MEDLRQHRNMVWDPQMSKIGNLGAEGKSSSELASPLDGCVRCQLSRRNRGAC